MPIFQDQSRQELRQVYVDAWRKQGAGLPLEPLEAQVADVVAEHPEYHELFSDSQTTLHADYAPEGGHTNPFLHMSVHLAIRDQVATDRPAGIRAAFEQLLRRKSKHEAEHAVMEHLAEMIWQSQRSGLPPDEQVYLRRVQRLSR
jgi:hypothetical protein